MRSYPANPKRVIHCCAAGEVEYSCVAKQQEKKLSILHQADPETVTKPTTATPQPMTFSPASRLKSHAGKQAECQSPYYKWRDCPQRNTPPGQNSRINIPQMLFRKLLLAKSWRTDASA